MLRGAVEPSLSALADPRPTAVIVGAGASGMLFTAQLLNACAEAGTGVRAVLIDRREHCGGAAYSTSDEEHRLNVTASAMSAYPDDSDHFVRWRARLAPSSEPGDYALRAEYGRYLTEVLAEAERRAAPVASLIRVVAEVESAEPERDRVRLALAGGGVLVSDLVVLALGNLPATTPPGYDEFAGNPRFVCDPWAPGGLERIASTDGDAALLIGSGLTMVDVALSVARSRPGMRLIAMARNGMVPRAHLPGGVLPTPAPTRVDPHVSLPGLVDRVLAEADRGNPRWRELVDGLRPVTQAHWRRLSYEQRADFMRTRHRAWSVHRHRMAPEVAARVAELLSSGQLEVHAGTPQLTSTADGRLAVELPGGECVPLSLAVNCTGPARDPRASRQPLVRQLLAAGHVRAHPLGIGFDTAPGGVFRRADGATQSRLLTLGPTRIGELYETTAIPEIRAQAQDLALSVAARLAGEGDAGRATAHTA